jgi:hypothetical protein
LGVIGTGHNGDACHGLSRAMGATCNSAAGPGVDGHDLLSAHHPSPMTVLGAVAGIIGLPGLAAATHLGALALASLRYREAPGGPGDDLRLLVLVPAHDEERAIGRCLAAVEADRRPGDRVLVVADRCTDRTAEIARGFGAAVLERSPSEEPGRAAARQAGLEHARGLALDRVEARCDARLIVEQVTGGRDPANARLRELCAAVREEAERIGTVAFTWVPAEANGRAHALVAEALGPQR